MDKKPVDLESFLRKLSEKIKVEQKEKAPTH